MVPEVFGVNAKDYTDFDRYPGAREQLDQDSGSSRRIY
jgi:hypothetical protein